MTVPTQHASRAGNGGDSDCEITGSGPAATLATLFSPRSPSYSPVGWSAEAGAGVTGTRADPVGQEGWQATMNTAQQQALQNAFNMQCNALENGFGDYVDPTTVLPSSLQKCICPILGEVMKHPVRNKTRDNMIAEVYYEKDAYTSWTRSLTQSRIWQCQMTHRSYNTLECEDAPAEFVSLCKEAQAKMDAHTEAAGAQDAGDGVVGAQDADDGVVGAQDADDGVVGAQDADDGAVGALIAHVRSVTALYSSNGAPGAQDPQGARDANTSGIYSSDDEAAGSRRIPRSPDRAPTSIFLPPILTRSPASTTGSSNGPFRTTPARGSSSRKKRKPGSTNRVKCRKCNAPKQFPNEKCLSCRDSARAAHINGSGPVGAAGGRMESEAAAGDGSPAASSVSAASTPSAAAGIGFATPPSADLDEEAGARTPPASIAIGALTEDTGAGSAFSAAAGARAGSVAASIAIGPLSATTGAGSAFSATAGAGAGSVTASTATATLTATSGAGSAFSATAGAGAGSVTAFTATAALTATSGAGYDGLWIHVDAGDKAMHRRDMQYGSDDMQQLLSTVEEQRRNASEKLSDTEGRLQQIQQYIQDLDRQDREQNQASVRVQREMQYLADEIETKERELTMLRQELAGKRTRFEESRREREQDADRRKRRLLELNYIERVQELTVTHIRSHVTSFDYQIAGLRFAAEHVETTLGGRA